MSEGALAVSVLKVAQSSSIYTSAVHALLCITSLTLNRTSSGIRMRDVTAIAVQELIRIIIKVIMINPPSFVKSIMYRCGVIRRIDENRR